MSSAFQQVPWTCPSCGKSHAKNHYSFEGQIDYSKKVGKPGRVKYDREESCGYQKGDTESVHGVEQTGPQFNTDGWPRPRFCPHCGFEFKAIYIVKKYTDCCIRGCPNVATKNKDSKYPTCQEHVKILGGQ